MYLRNYDNIWNYVWLFGNILDSMWECQSTWKCIRKIIGDNILYVRVCEIIWKYTGVSERVIVTFQSLRVGRSKWGS